MRLFFAGGEAWSDLLLDLGVKHILFSYYYFRSGLRSSRGKAQQLLARLRKAKAKGYRFMLDSGAFTYQVKSHVGSTPPPAAYFEEYFDFVREYGDLFDVVVEFDIDNIVKVKDGHIVPKDDPDGRFVTTAEVDDWTNRMLDIQDLAPRVMPVYHTHRGKKWLQDWLVDTRSPLIGIASSITDGITTFIAQAHRFGKFTHGFAQTRIRTDMKYTPFDSVDSTTWLRADKYGGTCIFRNNKFIVLDHLHKADRRLYKSWYESWGLDFSKIAADDLKENRLATIIAWRELANSFEQKWFFRTQGKYPYLFNMWNGGEPLPIEHPMVTHLRKGEAP